MDKYFELYKTMGMTTYSAAELNVAPATMTAMVRRGYVEDLGGSPKRYKPIDQGKAVEVMAVLDKHLQKEFFTLRTSDRELGMLCSLNKGVVVDCWGNKFPLGNVTKIEIGGVSYGV